MGESRDQERLVGELVSDQPLAAGQQRFFALPAFRFAISSDCVSRKRVSRKRVFRNRIDDAGIRDRLVAVAIGRRAILVGRVGHKHNCCKWSGLFNPNTWTHAMSTRFEKNPYYLLSDSPA